MAQCYRTEGGRLPPCGGSNIADFRHCTPVAEDRQHDVAEQPSRRIAGLPDSSERGCQDAAVRSRSFFALESPPLAPLKAASPFALGKRARDAHSITESDDEQDELGDEARLPPGHSDPADDGGQGHARVSKKRHT